MHSLYNLQPRYMQCGNTGCGAGSLQVAVEVYAAYVKKMGAAFRQGKWGNVVCNATFLWHSSNYLSTGQLINCLCIVNFFFK